MSGELPFVDYAYPTVRDERAPLVLIGEAPGADEVKQGRPFCGRAGKLLDQQLATIGIDRNACLVANVFRFRPPDNRIDHFFASKRKAAAENDALDESYGKFGSAFVRARYAGEIAHLIATLETLKPRAVVVLGRVPLWALTGREGLTALRGQKLAGRISGVPIVPAYHPSYLARLINMDKNAEATFRGDLLLANLAP
ncbi:MAG: polymerase [Rhodospirillales bacterium]|nr:polymerase [Rhodospirillales bacterium]